MVVSSSSGTTHVRFAHADVSDLRGRHDLALSLFKCLIWPLSLPIVPRLIFIAFKFSQPFLVKKVTEFLSDEKAANDENIGYGLIGAYGLVYIGLAVSSEHREASHSP